MIKSKTDCKHQTHHVTIHVVSKLLCKKQTLLISCAFSQLSLCFIHLVILQLETKNFGFKTVQYSISSKVSRP